MRVSVIINTYNHAHYLAEAIESALNQTVKADEILIIDDGSTDNTQSVIDRYRSQVRYHYQQNSGIGMARNKGIELANGDAVAILDADDLWLPTKLQAQIAVLEANPKIDMVFGQVEQFYCPRISDATKQKIQCPSGIMPGYLASTMLIRKHSFHQAGYYDRQWSTGEFIDWYIKAKNRLNEYMLPELVLKRRIHDGHLLTRTQRNYQHYLHIIRNKLQHEKNAPSS